MALSGLAHEQGVSLGLRRQRERKRRAACAMTAEGDVEIANSAEEIYEKIADAGLMGKRALGAVTRIREIGSTLFVCGNYGQVYRRDEIGWAPIDKELAELGKNALSLPFPNAASVPMTCCASLRNRCGKRLISMIWMAQTRRMSMFAAMVGTSFTTTERPGLRSIPKQMPF
ncbi:hypothetical protein ATY76_06360 [Rhizobium sp. R339]|nr:hypothetical protein ATY76_06360 [Rhizobium sp. R339]